jgi:peptidoglycan LD-endopeptidase LytH
MGYGDRRGRLASSVLALGLMLGLTALPSMALAEEAPTAKELAAEQRRAEAEAKAEAEKAEREKEEAEKKAQEDKERAEREAARARLDAARDSLRQAEAALAASRGATRTARGVGNAAEGQRRAAEDELAPVIVSYQQAEERLRDARRRVRVLREDLEATQEALELARVQFEDRVVRAYKQGSVAAHATLPLVLVREAASPGELATAMKDLEVIAGYGAIRVDELVDELVRIEAQIVSAVAEREDAKDEVERTQGSIDEHEAAADARRSGALSAEANLLAAIRRELDLERAVPPAKKAVEQARAEYDEVLAEQDRLDGPPAKAPSESDDEDEPTASSAQRSDWLAGRQRALSRQQSVPSERRRAAADWICPVEGSRFVNDWGFPRSQDRRHEGTDVFADEGTPIVAAVDAEITAINRVDRFNGRSGFGGLTVTYEAEGARYYNAHLQVIAEGLSIGDEIEAGDVIGTVGRTGNARGTPPHLHLGVYIDDAAINPYPSLAVACAEDGRQTGTDEEAEEYAELEQRRAARAERRAQKEAAEREAEEAEDEDAEDDDRSRRARQEGDGGES